MKQIAQYQDGRIELQELPVPTAPQGGILVRTTHSVISIGTEKMKVSQAKMNLLQKARARPDQVRKVLDTARTLGWKNALEKVRNRLSVPTPLGYSAAGIVEAVDPHNTRFRVGDLVACAGAECAFHAEYLAVPDMLAAPVPEGVEGWQAAYTTVCSIALQAVRQSQVQLGEHVVVIGQGLIGLLVTNLLANAGARVMAVDVLRSRRDLCASLGAERTVILGQQNLADEVRAWTHGYGADISLVCTATDSNAPIEQAAEIARDRGRIVIVGITRVELPRGHFYEKELDIRYSRSYGPGRYEHQYEWGGVDYPVGYVRWTEQRNFQCCLALMQAGRLGLGQLTTRRLPFDQAVSVYESLASGTSTDVGVVLEYGTLSGSVGKPAPQVHAQPPMAAVASRLNEPVTTVDVIGAGNFARSMLLPHLKGRIGLGTVVNQTALSARHVQTKFGFAQASTDAGDATGPAVMISTRHVLHAPLVLAALAADRHVYVEKPLCLTLAELSAIDAAMSGTRGTLQVGFNRRFAPATQQLKAQLEQTPGPRVITYRVVPGRLDPASWYANHAESGGRVLGEACHFFDFCCYLAGSEPVRVFAQSVGEVGGRLPFPDSVTAHIEFADGSSGQVIYATEANTRYPKETVSVFAGNLSADIENFQSLQVYSRGGKQRTGFSSKGHPEQMAAWLAFLGGKAPHPMPYDQSRRSMLVTFAVLRSIQEGSAVRIDSL